MTYTASAHDITIENRTGTNQGVAIGEWYAVLGTGQRFRLPDVPPGATIVSTNGGWEWNVDGVLPTDESAKAFLAIAFSNGVVMPMIDPSYGPRHYVNLGKWMAFTFISFAIAMGLVRLLKLPSKETD